MKRWLILTALLLLPVAGFSQSTPQVQWEHDGLNVTSFKCVVDPSGSNTITDLGLPTPSGTTYSTNIDNCSGVMVNGTHTVKIQACNSTGCTDSVAITVVKL